MTKPLIKWYCLPFAELSVDQLYALLKLRQDVFVLEQTCLYPDIDNKDKHCHHLLGYQEDNLVALLRIVPPGLSYDEPSMGRVTTAREFRNAGIGRELVQQGVEVLCELYPGLSVKIGAQTYLKNFYASFGFEAVGDVYDEDGIPHIDMLLSNCSGIYLNKYSLR